MLALIEWFKKLLRFRHTSLEQMSIAVILENLPEYIYWKDKDRIYRGCNRKLAKAAGLASTKKIIGKKDENFGWSKERIATLKQHDDKILLHGEDVYVEEVIPLPKDNSHRIMLTHKIPLKDSYGNINGILGISVDITERKQEQAALEKAKTEIERLKAMSALGGMIAHELRTPLLTMKLTAGNLKEYFPALIHAYEVGVEQGQVKPIRQDIFDSIKLSLSDLENVVDYSNSTIDMVLMGIEHTVQDSTLEVKPCNIKAAVNKAVDQYPFKLNEKTLVNVKHIDNVNVLAQESIIIHVFYNLIKNALHAIQAASKGTITIWSDCVDDHVVIYFEDTALGMTDDQLDKIFEPFYTTKQRTAESIGLGLYFCRFVLAKLHSSIECDSESGKYTRFIIRIPRQK